MKCPDHPRQPAGRCPDCDAVTRPPTPEALAKLRAVLAATARPERADITHPRKATP